MDPWTVLVGLAVCCVSAVLIYVITFVSMREKTFEEVIAEQKKRQEEEKEKVRSDRKLEKEHMKKKYKKGKGDKPREKAAQASDREVRPPKQSEQNEHKMVNLELEPEIIEPSNTSTLGNKRNKTNSAPRKRSILHNKDEVAPIVEKAPELVHKPIKPLDDLELKKLHDMKTNKATAIRKGQHTDQEVKEEKLQKVNSVDLQHAAASEGKGAKPKNKSATANGNTVKGTHLVDILGTAELSDGEIQSLIDVLMTRQAAGASFNSSKNKKNQKGDPVAVMKKQLEDNERTLQEERQRAASSSIQVKELRSTLTAEREKVAALERHYQTQLTRQEGEVEALKARLSGAHAAHVTETGKMKLQLEQLEREKSADAAACIKLKQENKILQESLSKAVVDNAAKGDVSSLKQKVSIMEKELSSNAVRLNATENARKSSEEKLHKYEERIKTLEASKKSSEEAAKKQVTELKGEVRKMESQNMQVKADLKKATSALSSVEAECAMWKTKLQELEKHLSSLGDLGTKVQEVEHKNKELEASLKNSEKQLATAVGAQKEANTKLQESEDKKQELEGNLKNVEKQLADAVHSQKDMGMELQNFRQENSLLKKEMSLVQEKQQTQASSAAATNGDVDGKNDAKNFIRTSEHERIVSEKMAELSKVQTALDAQTKKNNEELKQAVAEREKVDREVLKRLFPTVCLSDDMEHGDWLTSFEQQAAQQLGKTSSVENAGEKLKHLADENSRLQADVEVFKNNIAILHSEKDRIHELEEENRKLHLQSETYEKNFMHMNADMERLQHIEEENQRLKTMSSSRSSMPAEVSQLEEENQNLLCRLQEKEENIAEVENKLRNLEQVIETEEKKWKEKLKHAEEALAKGSDPSNREQELEDLTIQQQTQIEHYRSVLTNTEQLLRQLESAEKSWEEKLQASQDDLQKSKVECQKVQEELQSLRGSTEMQCKVDSLQEELRLSSEHVDSLVKQNEQLTGKVIVLESQGKAIAQVDSENLKKEVEELKGQLEGERKRNKDLSSTLVRLNGIIKTGQDALSQEQKMVQQLQEQLSDRTKAAGPNANQELEQLRSKLSDKEKQLEREIAANKQLSQRLGQLGVLQGTSTGSDHGTAV